MGAYRLAAPAEAMIVRLLADSQSQFGTLARERYARLLVTAMSDIAAEPRRLGVEAVRVLEKTIYVYHLRYSRRRVPEPPGRVAEPRHLLVFRMGEDGVIEILGLMHERMLPKRAIRRIIRLAETDI